MYILKNKKTMSLASVRELQSPQFVNFMQRLNSFAKDRNLRQFTNWSKVWEYPWLWFNGLMDIKWEGIKLLDLGSELSSMPWYIASLGAEVILIEKSPEWIPIWEEIKQKDNVNVSWQIVFDENLPFENSSFDVVTSFSVIEHQQNKELAINEVARVLKTGGMFAISFDICEPSMGMTFPAWNGSALTKQEFEKIIWNHPLFNKGNMSPKWNIEDCKDFINWHLQSAPYHNYVVGAAILIKQ